MKHSRSMPQKLTMEEIRENIVIIKINKSFREGMSKTELYDVTRGCWKRKIASVEKAEYALAVVYGIVKEVYQIDEWLLAENEVRETISYNEAVDAGRIIFKGRTADEEIRKKYLDYSVAGLFKRGEVAPVKVILKPQEIGIL
ncbi:hypothetical protein AALC75_25610 [Lachnospiraceae bacterium 48-42]|nr:hypothetical protein [Lachnospiraceae bacterium]